MTNLTPEQITKYLADPYHCPCCEDEHSMDCVWSGAKITEWECLECGAKWQEREAVISIKLISGPTEIDDKNHED